MNELIIVEEFKDPAVFDATMFIRKHGQQQYVWVTFLALVCLVCSSFATSELARAIACEGIDSNSGPLGLGRPSFGLK